MSQTDLVNSNCSSCHILQHSEPNLDNHLKPNHEEASANECTAFSCVVCKQNFTSHDNHAAHMADHHRTSPGSGLFQCDICDQNFNSNIQLSEHIASTHEPAAAAAREFTFTCDDCGRKFASTPQLLEHTESEHAKCFLTCTFCVYRCSTETHLSDHIEAFHSADESLNPSTSATAGNQL